MSEALAPEVRPFRSPLAGRLRQLATGLAVSALLALAAFVELGWDWRLGVCCAAAHPDELPPGPLLEAARSRGTLIVGVRQYPRPALPGTAAPAEPDLLDAALARALGDYLHIPVELVGLPSGEREAALERGRVDLLIAGAAERPDEAALPVAGADEAGALLALRGLDLAEDQPLRGRPVCLTEGSPYRRELVERHGAAIRLFPSSVHAISAFLAGECTALAEQAGMAEWLLRQPDWRFYRRLPVTLRPGIIGHVRLPMAEPHSRAWLAAALQQWRRSGAQQAALNQRLGETSLDVLKLEDGLTCH